RAAVRHGLRGRGLDDLAGDAGAGREPDPDDLAGAGTPRRLVDELAGGLVDQRDRRRGRTEHAGGGVHDASVSSIETASETPVSVRNGAPSALAKAATEATRRSGIISRPAAIVRS